MEDAESSQGSNFEMQAANEPQKMSGFRRENEDSFEYSSDAVEPEVCS